MIIDGEACNNLNILHLFEKHMIIILGYTK